jgi:hypothetical protein
LSGATRESSEPTVGGLQVGTSVWYRWTAPATGTVVFTLSNYSFSAYIASYTGTSLAGLTSVSGNTISGFVNINATAGTTYVIGVDKWEGTAGSFVLSWAYTSPVITSSPSSLTVAAGTSAAFSVVASGSSLSYQWNYNGTPIAGATSASYTVPIVASSHAGSYTVTVSNPGGSSTSSAAVLTVSTGIAYLSNLSVLAQAGTGSQTLTVGLTVGGGSGAPPILIRGIGPTLSAFGVGSVLADPILTVYRGVGVTRIATNDDWGGDPAITAANVSVGAFALPAASKDAALFGSGFPAGGYIAEISGKGGTSGTALVELYHAESAGNITATSPRLINLSARTVGGTGANTLVVGFTVGGTGFIRVLVRASGPALTQFGVTGTMPDPKLELYRANGPKLSENDDWDPSTLAAQNSVGAFKFPAGSKDAVLSATLAPGSYTAQVVAGGSAAGVTLVEVYELP